MGDEYHPLIGLRCGDDLPLGWKTVGDFLRQVPGRPKLTNVLLLDGGDHPLALTSGSGHGRLSGKEMSTWALGLEIGKTETERGHERGRGSPYPIIKAANIKSLLTRPKNLPVPKGSCEWHGWITQTLIDEDPVIGGLDLCFDRTCQ